MAKKVEMNENEMVQFVNENNDIVPKNRRNKFLNMSIDEQVESIKKWQEIKKLRNEWAEKNKIENRVVELLTKRNATTEDVLKVIEVCKDYIKDCKEKELAKIDDEIARLNNMKKSIEENIQMKCGSTDLRIPVTLVPFSTINKE